MPNVEQLCPRCNAAMIKDGFTPSRRQRYECPECGKKNSVPPLTPAALLGPYLKEIRESKNITRETVEDRLGRSDEWLSGIEEATDQININDLFSLAAMYEMRPSEVLLGYEQRYYKKKK